MDFGNVFTGQVPPIVWCHFTCKQARVQLGTPEGAKNFLRGAKFFKVCPTHFSRGAKNFQGVLSSVASTKIGGRKNVLFQAKTLFCLGYHLSKHKMTVNSKNLGGHGLFGSPGYAYGGSPLVTSLLVKHFHWVSFFVSQKLFNFVLFLQCLTFQSVSFVKSLSVFKITATVCSCHCYVGTGKSVWLLQVCSLKISCSKHCRFVSLAAVRPSQFLCYWCCFAVFSHVFCSCFTLFWCRHHFTVLIADAKSFCFNLLFIKANSFLVSAACVSARLLVR